MYFSRFECKQHYYLLNTSKLVEIICAMTNLFLFHLSKGLGLFLNMRLEKRDDVIFE